MNFSNRRSIVLGLGNSGYHAAKLLLSKRCDVALFDDDKRRYRGKDALKLKKMGATFFDGGIASKDIGEYDFIVKSPGFDARHQILKSARRMKLPVIGEIELGYLIAPQNIVGLTGTSGKSTTVTLIGKMLQFAKKPSIVCGNIGLPFCAIAGTTRAAVHKIIELSSFQLADTRLFRAHIAVLLNIAPNHLDHHKSYADYRRAKFRIFDNQAADDYAIINKDCPVIRRFLPKIKAQKITVSLKDKTSTVYYDSGNIIFRKNKTKKVIPLKNSKKWNDVFIHDALAAAATAMMLGVKPEAVARALARHKHLPHRFGKAKTRRGVAYYNDSKSTTAYSAHKALRALGQNVVMIAGGIDKGNDYSVFGRDVAGCMKAMVVYGKDRRRIKNYFDKKTRVYAVNNLAGAVKKASTIAARGDKVLFSPMCSSFDMFDNYVKRGEAFETYVKKLGNR